MQPDIIHTFWHGKLTRLEKACLSSFVRHGHPVFLWVYDWPEGIPSGVTVLNASEIVPKHLMDGFQNLANFSDKFRYEVLYDKGGYWTDCDVFCLKRFQFQDEHVFATQLIVERTKDEVTTCLIKAPKGSPVMKYCLDKIVSINTKTNAWSALGPALLLEANEKLKMEAFRVPHRTFCPVHYFDAPDAIFGPESGKTVFEPMTHAVHLWNEERRRKNVDADADHPGSLFERLIEIGR